MSTESLARTCPTCGHARKPDEFYETSVECRDCKRERSRANRNLIAQKVALADRLLDLVERLAERGALTGRADTNRGPAGDATTSPNPSIGPQEVLS